MTTEARIQSEIQLLVGGLPDVRIWRNNVAQAWVGEVIHRDPKSNTITLRNPRPLHAGLCVGSSDLIGLRRIQVGDRMIGQFVALEVKAPRGTVTTDQEKFLTQIEMMGGLSIVARSAEEALDKVMAGL